MGEARRKLMDASKLVRFDLSSPKMIVGPADKENLKKLNQPIMVSATKVLIVNLVQAKFPQGASREDRRMWAAWIEAMEENDNVDIIIEMPKSQLQWLVNIAKDDNLSLPVGMSQWAEAFIDAADAVLTEEASI